MTITNKLYDKLKFIAQVLLPALGTLYFSLAGIWGLPSAEQVVGSIAVINTFLGVLLQFSSKGYSKNLDGSLKVLQKSDGKKIYSLELDGDPEDIDHKDVIQFKVVKSQPVRGGKHHA